MQFLPVLDREKNSKTQIIWICEKYLCPIPMVFKYGMFHYIV